MTSKDEVTVVIPVLNEEQAIGKVLDEVLSEGYTNVLVVDGYSTDRTVDIAKSKGVKVVFQHGPGKTGAIKTAIEILNTKYMVVMDGDYTYSAKDIERLLQPAIKYPYVIGVRDKRNISKLHRLGNWIITKAFNLLMQTSLSDICSGMYLIRSDVAKELKLGSRGFRTEVEIAAQIASEREVTEVPISYRQRIGKPKLSTWRHGFELLLTVLDLARAYNPVFLFSSITSLIIIPALMILLWVFIEMLRGIWHGGWALFGVMLLLLATQSASVALISLLIKRVEKRLAILVERISERKS